MSTFRHARVFAIAALLAISQSGCDKGAGNAPGSGGAGLSIGRMKVSVMPEYDDPGVLAIYDGKFEEVSNYPIKTSFLIPKGSVISDACSLSHEGQHFCQLYRTVNRGAHDEVNLMLPYPNFYLSFHTPHLDTATEKKAFDYLIKANHPIKTLEVVIQQPLRSTAFNIVAPAGAVVSEKTGSISVIKGFNHFAYRLESVAKGQESAFKIGYLKSDPQPSVDIKFTSMQNPPTRTAPYETQRNVKNIVYIFFGAGVLGVLVLVAWLFRAGKKKRGKAP